MDGIPAVSTFKTSATEAWWITPTSGARRSTEIQGATVKWSTRLGARRTAFAAITSTETLSGQLFGLLQQDRGPAITGSFTTTLFGTAARWQVGFNRRDPPPPQTESWPVSIQA